MRGHALILWLALGAIWGGSYLFIRVAAPVLGPFPLMALRVVIAAAALGVVAWARREPLPLRANAVPLLWLGFVHAAAPYALLAAAEVRITASTAAVLMAAQPLWTAVLGARARHERPARSMLVALALGLGGVGLLVGWRPGPLDPGAALAMLATLVTSALYAIGSLYAQRRLSHLSPLALTLGQLLGAAAWLSVPALLTWPRVVVPSAVVASVVALALAGTALAYLLFFGLIRSVGALRASTVCYLIPPFGVLWGALWLGEHPTPGLLAGLAVILASLLVMHARMPVRARSLPRASAVAPAASR